MIAYVGSYPPRECGIATFTRDVIAAIQKLTRVDSTVVIAVNEPTGRYGYPSRVKCHIERDVAASYDLAADAVNASDCELVSVQHEYGLFGGTWGSFLLRFMDRVRHPTVLTLHTVLPNPDPALRTVTQSLVDRSAMTIVLARSAIEILADDYGVAREKVRFIPHGVPDVQRLSQAKAKRALGLEGRTVLATCGLMNPGKGIQYAIEAVATLVNEFPDLLYLVVGETHPGVIASSGEAYRDQLEAEVRGLGLEAHVRFDNRYISYRELVLHLLATDVYLVPYLDLNQVVSGTVAYALGCGRAVVSTPSTYAREVLADGRGVLTAERDSRALGAAVSTILRDAAYRNQLEERAYLFGHQMTWPRVAQAYSDVYQEVRSGEPLRAQLLSDATLVELAIPA